MRSELWLKIQSQWDKIVNDLLVSRVLDSLMGKLGIDFDDYERITKQETEKDKARKLLEILKQKDDNVFYILLAALDENEYKYIADAIKEANISQASVDLYPKEVTSISTTETIPSYQKDIDHLCANLKSVYQSEIKLQISIFNTDEQVQLDKYCVDLIIKQRTEGVCTSNKSNGWISSYKQIFADSKNKRIILTGQAGSGKSTFCKKLVSIWCEESNRSKSTHNTEKFLKKEPEELLLQFCIVFYVYAPELTNENTLIEYLCNRYMRNEANNPSEKDKLQTIFDEVPEKILIVLDGMDEMGDNVPRFLSDIIGRKLYPRMTVLMAMRHFRISELGLKTKHDLLLETEGFNKENAFKVVKNIIELNNRHTSMEKPCPSAGEEEQFSVFKKTPLLLMFITHIWWQDQCLPKRRKDLYKQVLYCLIKKCLLRTGNRYTPNMVTQGSMAMQIDMFCELYLDSACMTAYHFLIVERNSTIPEERLIRELGESSKFKLKVLSDCGILSCNEAFSPLQRHVSIKFLHFSVQEYLTCMYLVNNEDALQTFLTCLKSLNHIHKYKNLFIFICGLDAKNGHMAFRRICEVCEEDPLVTQFRQGRDDDGEIKYSLQDLNLMYKECLKEMDPQEIVEIPDIVSLEDEWYETEMSRLRTSISKSLYLCCITLQRDDALEMSSMVNLTFLSLCGVSMSKTCSRSLCSSIKDCTHLTTLKLEGMTLNDHILDLSCLPNLKFLTLAGESTSEKCICSGISDCTNLERLNLKRIKLDYYVQDLIRMPNLTCLTLDHVTMSSNCSKSFCTSLSTCTSLTTLQLKSIQLHDGIIMLSKLTKLTSLTLNNISISDECKHFMFSNISCCANLKELHLAFISMHDLGFVKDLKLLTVCDLDDANKPYKTV